MNARKMSAQETRRYKAAQAKFRRDLAAFIKFVNINIRRMKAGRHVLMVVNVVDLKTNGVACVIIKGPPNPPSFQLRIAGLHPRPVRLRRLR